MGNPFAETAADYVENSYKPTEIQKHLSTLRTLIDSGNAKELLSELCSLYGLPESDQHHSRKHGRSSSSDESPETKKQKMSREQGECSVISGPHSPATTLIKWYPSGSPSSVPSSTKTDGVKPSVLHQGQYSRGPPLQGKWDILKKYFGRPDFSPACYSMKIALKSAVKEVMDNINSSSFSVTSGLEAATLINLWKHFDPKLEVVGEAASQGALQLEEGEKLLNDGKTKLEQAFNEINRKLLFDDPSLD